MKTYLCTKVEVNSTFSSKVTEGTNRPTDRPTDRPTERFFFVQICFFLRFVTFLADLAKKKIEFLFGRHYTSYHFVEVNQLSSK